ncbi:Protein disulfide-isomerase 5-1 [Rhynchospora pubera]|uniref:Protein disulfide-isomerase 5-1 n=1 Tax=Rhynchospora pubera TaxID=906938 RepID=A0AAV8HLG0_9POAL|nr:Protein disulfide-isomerase 5-1 [Rhynchospora pubera]
MIIIGSVWIRCEKKRRREEGKKGRSEKKHQRIWFHESDVLSPLSEFDKIFRKREPARGARKRNRTPTMDLVLARYLCLSSILVFSLLSISLPQTRAEVITLTAETFTDKVKEKDTVWFVKFCVPWCKHCKNLGTLWEDFGKEMEGEDEIEIGEVDCGLQKEVCSKADIHSYPTFKVFYDGEEAAKFKGKRDVESLKNFVLEEAEKLAAKQLARE